MPMVDSSLAEREEVPITSKDVPAPHPHPVEGNIMMFRPTGAGKSARQVKSSQEPPRRLDAVRFCETADTLGGLRRVSIAPTGKSRKRENHVDGAPPVHSAPGVNADRWRRPPLVRYGSRYRSGETKTRTFLRLRCSAWVEYRPNRDRLLLIVIVTHGGGGCGGSLLALLFTIRAARLRRLLHLCLCLCLRWLRCLRTILRRRH